MQFSKRKCKFIESLWYF